MPTQPKTASRSSAEQNLEADIRNGIYKEGDILPSDIDLAGQLGISRYAAREAYAELVRKGLVKRVKRKGTIVTYNRASARLPKVGLILGSDVPSYYIFEKGVAQVLGDRGTGLRVKYNYNYELANQEAIQDALDHDVDGLIVSPPPGSHFEQYHRLRAQGFPIVLALASNPGVHCVYPDDHKAGQLIGEHFGEMGFRSPAVVTDDMAYAQLRVYGFREGVARYGMRLNDEHMLTVTYANDEGRPLSDLGRNEAEQIRAMDPKPDCVFAVNDTVAISIYYWLLKFGVKVPEDIGIAGIDHLGARLHPFQLTTVDIGLEAMGREAAILMQEQLKNPQDDPIQKKIEPRLVISDSTLR